MIAVKDIMTKDVVTVKTATDVAQAARLLLENHINGLPVVDDEGRVVGIICQSDLITQQKSIQLPSLFTLLDGFVPLTSIKHLEKEIQKMSAVTVADAMTSRPVTVGPDASIEDVATLMVDKKFHTIPVVKDGKLVGILGKEDLLKAFIAHP
ncbi:MAG: CBS domain-containing protein [Deltaproteobacteria bacterium]|nr:CBS domain-containing protein [Deltaproteobacteria bacterium]